jgi:hypothetical protein
MKLHYLILFSTALVSVSASADIKEVRSGAHRIVVKAKALTKAIRKYETSRDKRNLVIDAVKFEKQTNKFYAIFRKKKLFHLRLSPAHPEHSRIKREFHKLKTKFFRLKATYAKRRRARRVTLAFRNVDENFRILIYAVHRLIR